MRNRVFLGLGYLVLLIVVYLLFKAASISSSTGSFYISLDNSREVALDRLGEPDFLDLATGEMVWSRRHFLVRFEMRAVFDADDMPRSVLVLRRIGTSWAGWTFVSDDYRRHCRDFGSPEVGP